MSGPDTAALREQVVRWMRDDDGCANTIPATPDDVLALADECDRLRGECAQHERRRIAAGRTIDDLSRRAEAAETERDALRGQKRAQGGMADKIERLREQVEDLRSSVVENVRARDCEADRAEAAEALAAPYEQALREICEYRLYGQPWDGYAELKRIAQAALAAGSGGGE